MIIASFPNWQEQIKMLKMRELRYGLDFAPVSLTAQIEVPLKQNRLGVTNL